MMFFDSIIFIFSFLPIVLLVNFFLPIKLRNYFLLFASLYFYYLFGSNYVIILLISIFVNFLCGLLIEKFYDRKSTAKSIVVFAITFNIGLLVYSKYTNFILSNLQFTISRVYLVLGISFFTFQALSYIIDVYRKETKAEKNIFNLGLFLSFFPKLIAGPITKYKDVSKQIIERVNTLDDFSYGICRFIIGLGKKILIANNVAIIVNSVFMIPADHLNFSLAWIGILCFALQIYFDFSGYSDMAIGLASMFGFRINENFNYPYVSRSVKEFWTRWHISLTSWFKDYLYIPLGGNRKGKYRTYLNLIIVFTLCGLWHGPSWTFLIWGLYNGFFLILERTKLGNYLERLPNFLRHIYLILVVMIGWVFFRADSLDYAIHFICAMIGLGSGDGILYHISLYLNLKIISAIILGIIGSTRIIPLIKEKTKEMPNKHMIYTLILEYLVIIFLVIIFLFCIIELAGGTYNPFIYSRF